MSAFFIRAAGPLLLGGCVLCAACEAHSATQPVADTKAQSGNATGDASDDADIRDITVDADVAGAIKTATLRVTELPRTLMLAGKVQFDEDFVSRVLAPLSGQVVDLKVKIGEAVHKGQSLGSINSREVAAAISEHLESHKDYDLAEKTATMTQDLFDHQAASRIALQQAQNELAKAKGRVERTEEALRVLGLDPNDSPSAARLNGRVPIVSPIAGTVIERHVTEGQFVQPDSMPLMVVANLSTVWVVGDVAERDLRFVSVGDRAAIAAAAFPGESFEGRVDYISDAIDPATRTAKVRVTVANRDSRLKPEMYASIDLGLMSEERALTVPARATFTESGRTWIYVALAANRFVRRPIEVDQDQGPNRRVLKGLQEGDRVVTDGALLLRQEEEKRAG